MNVVVNTNEFIDHLKEQKLFSGANDFMKLLEDRNLLVVDRNYLNELIDDAELTKMQQKLLKKDALTPYEIAKYKLTHYTSLHGVKTSNLIYPEEFFKGEDNKLMVAMCAIKRIREIKNL